MATLRTSPQRSIRWSRYTGYLFIAPLFIGIFAFIVIPILVSLGMSFTKWDIVTPPEFNGVQNYIQLLTSDRLFWRVLGNTLRYIVMSIPLAVTILGAGGAEPEKPGLRSSARVLLPLVTSVVASGCCGADVRQRVRADQLRIAGGWAGRAALAD